MTTKPNIYQRIAAVMHDVPGVEKDSSNQGKYKYAGHEAVTKALRGAYVRHGIVRTASVVENVRDGKLLRLVVCVRWINVDDPTDSLEVMVPGESLEPTSMSASPTQVGVALSYAIKNAEFKIFSLTGDTTPDAEVENEERVDAEALRDMLIDQYEAAESVSELREIDVRVRAEWKRVSRFKTELLAAKDLAKGRLT